MGFKNAFAVAVAVSVVVFSAAFQPVEAATTTYTGPFAVGAGTTINAGDTALLNNGATVTGTGVITTNGTLQFNQTGTLTFGNTISGTGTLSVTNTGTLNLTSTPRDLDLTTSVSGNLRFNNGSGQIRVGNTGTGTLIINGGSVNNGLAYLGNSAGSLGSATVTGGTWNNTQLTVGGSGAGSLNVSGGQVISSLSYVGRSAGSVGSVTVSSGTWLTDGSASVYIGESGTGTLTVNGGYVGDGGADNTSLFYGRLATGVGSGTVSSGTLEHRNIYVGAQGTGTLNISGGYVESEIAYLGAFLGSVGSSTVSSGTWTNTAQFYVGDSGTGTLTVNGGYLDTRDTEIGSSAGGVGLATVSSGTWKTGGPFIVGVSGSGTLTIDGGLVVVGASLDRGASGIINLNTGGTLQIGEGGPAAAVVTTDLTNNGTLIFNHAFYDDYSYVISGTGAVMKQGNGAQIFTGTNTYTGPTNVDAGGLYVDGLLGNTAVTVNAGALGGSGTILGNVTVAASGTIAPSYPIDFVFYTPPPQALTVGSLSLAANSYAVLNISGTTPLANEYDQLVGSGTAAALTYGGNLDLLLTGSYATGTTWELFDNFLTPTGDFAAVGVTTAPGDEYFGLTFTNTSGVWKSTTTANNQYLEFTQSTGNLVVVPEPSTIAMALAGLACGGWQVVRRGRRLRQAASLSA